MSVKLGKGIFLVAAPSLRDPNFCQTVVLLCEHGPQGALGVVINRPTAIHIAEALPQVPVLEGQRHLLFSGGPVQPTHVLLLLRTRQALDNAHHVFDGVYMGGDVAVLEQILTVPGETSTFRAYMGYAGWAPGQLEQEMKSGSWITRPADPTVVFDKDPLSVWANIMQSLGGCYELYAHMPADPSLN